MNINRLISLLLIVFTLNGCVGLAVGTLGTVEKKRLYISNYGVPIYVNNEGKKRFRANGSDYQEAFTKEEMISLIGKPDSQSTDGKCEVLSYTDGLSWGWVGAFILILPIALPFPVGLEETQIYFKYGTNWAVAQEEVGFTSKLGSFCFLLTHGYDCSLLESSKQIDLSASCQ